MVIGDLQCLLSVLVQLSVRTRLLSPGKLRTGRKYSNFSLSKFPRCLDVKKVVMMTCMSVRVCFHLAGY